MGRCTGNEAESQTGAVKRKRKGKGFIGQDEYFSHLCLSLFLAGRCWMGSAISECGWASRVSAGSIHAMTILFARLFLFPPFYWPTKMNAGPTGSSEFQRAASECIQPLHSFRQMMGVPPSQPCSVRTVEDFCIPQAEDYYFRYGIPPQSIHAAVMIFGIGCRPRQGAGTGWMYHLEYSSASSRE